MEVTSREPLNSLASPRALEPETCCPVMEMSAMLPAHSYKLAKEAMPRIVVVLKAGVPHALLASVAHPWYVQNLALSI
jgi:hypothetical protein